MQYVNTSPLPINHDQNAHFRVINVASFEDFQLKSNTGEITMNRSALNASQLQNLKDTLGKNCSVFNEDLSLGGIEVKTSHILHASVSRKTINHLLTKLGPLNIIKSV